MRKDANSVPKRQNINTISYFNFGMTGARRSTFYSARLYFSQSLYDFEKELSKRIEDFNKKLLDFVMAKEGENISNNPAFEWRLGDIESDKKTFIFGRLGKIRKGKTINFYDKVHKSFEEKESDESEAEVSNFYINLEKHLIVFEDRQYLGYKDFIIVFSSAFSKHIQKDDALDIEPISDKVVIENILKKAKKLLKAYMVLKPQNPDMNEDSKIIDEALKDIHADSAKIEVKSKNGLLYKKKNILSSGIAQANRGYGHYSIDYQNEQGEFRTFKSKKRTYVVKDDLPAGKKEIKQKLKSILEKALEIIDKS